MGSGGMRGVPVYLCRGCMMDCVPVYRCAGSTMGCVPVSMGRMMGCVPASSTGMGAGEGTEPRPEAVGDREDHRTDVA